MTRFRAPVARGLITADPPVDAQPDLLPTDAPLPNDPPSVDEPIDTTPDLPSIDRTIGVIYGVSAMQAVEALGHGVLVDDIALQQVADAGNSAKLGIKSRFTHPGMCEDGMGSMVGRVKNYRVVADKVIGDLHLNDSSATSPRGDLRTYILDLAEEDPAAFGMSVVVDQQLAWKMPDGTEVPGDQMPSGLPADTLPYLRILKLHAVDMVDEPAANRDGLFAAFASTTNIDAAQAFTQLDLIRERLHLSIDQAKAFLDRYFAARTKPLTLEDPPMRFSLAAFAALLAANTDIATELTTFANDPANVEADEAAFKAKIVELKNAAAIRTTEVLRINLAAAQTALLELQTKYDALAALKPGHQDPGADDQAAILAAKNAGKLPTFTKAQLAAGEIPEKIKLSGLYEIVDG